MSKCFEVRSKNPKALMAQLLEEDSFGLARTKQQEQVSEDSQEDIENLKRQKEQLERKIRRLERKVHVVVKKEEDKDPLVVVEQLDLQPTENKRKRFEEVFILQI